jgi:beta-lysine 5,6-aminomutase beta subunit
MNTTVQNPAPTHVRAYGDHRDDGLVQVSFTLPLPEGPAARRAAAALASSMGLRRPDVVHVAPLERNMTYFIVYGECTHRVAVDSAADVEDGPSVWSHHEIEEIVANDLGRSVTIVGASTGTDTHSVGIDAILNMKGYNGHYGLERYKGFNVFNLGSQVPNAVLIAKAREVAADAVLVSQTVSQQNLHVDNLSELVDMIEAEGLREQMLLVCGGPRITDELAKELGFDAGFSTGTYAYHVGSFVIKELLHRRGSDVPACA